MSEPYGSASVTCPFPSSSSKANKIRVSCNLMNAHNGYPNFRNIREQASYVLFSFYPPYSLCSRLSCSWLFLSPPPPSSHLLRVVYPSSQATFQSYLIRLLLRVQSLCLVM